MWGGCLWNTFVIVARLSTFLGLFLIAMPELYEAFRAVEPDIGEPSEETRMERLYRRIPSGNFSEEVLVKCPFNLAVLQLNGVEWKDLGEPRQIRELLPQREGRQALSSRSEFAAWRSAGLGRKPPTQAGGPQGSAGNLS
jgi:hypothetical protein